MPPFEFVAGGILCVAILGIALFFVWDERRMNSIARSLTAAGYVVDRPKFLQLKSDDPLTRAIELGARMRWHTTGTFDGRSFSLAESLLCRGKSSLPRTAIHVAAPAAGADITYSKGLLLRLLSQHESLAPGWSLVEGDPVRGSRLVAALEALRRSTSLPIYQITIDQAGILIKCHRRLNASRVSAFIEFARDLLAIVGKLPG